MKHISLIYVGCCRRFYNLFVLMLQRQKGVYYGKYAWKAMIIEGKLSEYQRRHDEIWPEMLEVLKKAGIKNYTIWNTGNELFGYYECEKGVEFAARVQKESPVVERWNKYMKDVMVMETDPDTGVQPQLKKIFTFE